MNAVAAVNAAAGTGGGGSGSSCRFRSVHGHSIDSLLGLFAVFVGIAAATGVESGRLSGPPSADFDLYLQRRSGTSWTTVERSEGSTAIESIDYNGTASTYRWRVYAYAGSGAFTLCASHP